MAPTNAPDVFFGAYLRFSTEDKRAGAALAGPDNAVGDIGSIVWKLDDDKSPRAWIENPYGQLVGFLDKADSHRLALYRAKEWTIRTVLSFTAYSEGPDQGEYWGQVAVFAYAPRHADTFETFVRAFARKAADGLRPDPALGQAGVRQVIENPDAWVPGSKTKIPAAAGTAVLKDHRTLHDKMLDQSRNGNKGCLIGGWAFILAVVAAIVWALHSIGLF